MGSILGVMQETVMKYAEVLSKILRVDVEIVDNNLVRIAGTGMYFDSINENMGEEGYVYREVIRSGKEQIVMEPGSHPICRFCNKQGNCNETFEVSMPIKIDEEVIGVIGLVCFTEKQRDHILDNLSIFTEFLEQISDLISSKAKEESEKLKMINLIGVLKNIIDKVEQGVIVIDQDNNIKSINNMAMKILNLTIMPKSKVEIEHTGNDILNFHEYDLFLENKNYIILGEDYKVIKSHSKFDKVYIFTDINTLENLSTSVVTTRENLGLEQIIGDSQELKALKTKVKRIASSNSTVLITGESGTGKELFARAIHMESDRVDSPFVAINCAAIPDALLESELFGYIKGAFTGADPKGKIGKIEFANKGTLFLDEIGDMPIYLQSKLLRVLEQREIIRLGSNTPIPIDVKIIAATNKDLEELIKNNIFREDLYYRLNVIPFQIPPLRERKEDIKVMTNYFAIKYSNLFKKQHVKIHPEVWDLLSTYNWPGNVRELENVVEYAMNMVEVNGTVKSNHLPKSIIEENTGSLTLSLEHMEKEYIKKAFKLYGISPEGKQKSADELGIGIATLYRKIKKYNLQ